MRSHCLFVCSYVRCSVLLLLTLVPFAVRVVSGRLLDMRTTTTHEINNCSHVGVVHQRLNISASVRCAATATASCNCIRRCCWRAVGLFLSLVDARLGRLEHESTFGDVVEERSIHRGRALSLTLVVATTTREANSGSRCAQRRVR